MKRVGRLNGKTIIQGDPNTVTPNQILAKIDPTNGGGGSNIELKERTNSGLKNITSSDDLIYFTLSNYDSDYLLYVTSVIVIKTEGKVIKAPLYPVLTGVISNKYEILYCGNIENFIIPGDTIGKYDILTFDEFKKLALDKEGIIVQKVNPQDLI